MNRFYICNGFPVSKSRLREPTRSRVWILIFSADELSSGWRGGDERRHPRQLMRGRRGVHPGGVTRSVGRGVVVDRQ